MASGDDRAREVNDVPVIWDPAYEVDIGAHVFATAKYRLVRNRLVEEGTLTQAAIVAPVTASDNDVLRVHTSEYVQRIRSDTFTDDERFLLEVPFSEGLREAMWLCAGGTMLAGEAALETGSAAVHLGGGFHHAFPDHGEGFCLINDVAVAVRALQRTRDRSRFVVIDCDVHHGNGTATIFRDDPNVFTFSMHQERNYPMFKPPGDLDIALADRTGDEEYLSLLRKNLAGVLDAHRPVLAFYLAGADPYEGDQLGGLDLTLDGLLRRDQTVFKMLKDAGIPVAVTLAGGYAQRHSDTVEIHCGTVRAALQSAAA